MLKKIKVLQFPIANSKGGITQYALQNWKFIDKEKFQFDFATLSTQLDFEDELKDSGAEVFYISCSAEKDKIQFEKEFREILIKGNYDVIHLHTGKWKSFLAEKIAKEVGIKKIIVHAHNTGIDILDNDKRLQEEILHNTIKDMIDEEIATDYWACSQKAADFLYGDKISKDKIVIMNNAIDLEKFSFQQKTRDTIRKEFGIKENECVIGTVGRLVYAKNQEFLLQMFNKLCQIRNDCKLLIVGEGERYQEYFDYVHVHGLQENVIFTGFRKDVNKILQAMDVFCLPSRFEGLPIGLIEAQAAGVRCIVCDNISKTAKISNLVKFIPLKQELWISELINVLNLNFERNSCDLENTGFDIKQQIKLVEQLYSKF